MVKEAEKKGQKLYQCESCGFAYADKKLASDCEAYCTAHHSCNIEITKHAVPLD